MALGWSDGDVMSGRHLDGLDELPLANRLVNDLIREWLDIGLNLTAAGTGTHTSEERAKQEAISEVRNLALAGWSYQLTPYILDALRRAGLLVDRATQVGGGE